jgi:hypothetical protein
MVPAGQSADIFVDLVEMVPAGQSADICLLVWW